MKFQPTVYVTHEILDQLREGTLTLKKGQWIHLAWTNKKSRWVGVRSSGTVWAVHFPTTLSQFQHLCKCL